MTALWQASERETGITFDLTAVTIGGTLTLVQVGAGGAAAAPPARLAVRVGHHDEVPVSGCRRFEQGSLPMDELVAGRQCLLW